MDNVIYVQTNTDDFVLFIDEVLENKDLLTDALCRLSIYTNVKVIGYQIVRHYEKYDEYEEKEIFELIIDDDFVRTYLNTYEIVELLCGIKND
jgi:hypothetical protein